MGRGLKFFIISKFKVWLQGLWQKRGLNRLVQSDDGRGMVGGIDYRDRPAAGVERKRVQAIGHPVAVGVRQKRIRSVEDFSEVVHSVPVAVQRNDDIDDGGEPAVSRIVPSFGEQRIGPLDGV